MAKALDTTCQLKGVGPATASLILSCFRPDCVPFFSDEMYRWLCWDDPATKGMRGWKRQIGYTKKEFTTLIDRARALLERLRSEDGAADVDMLALEKAAYVLGKEEVDLDDDGAEREGKKVKSVDGGNMNEKTGRKAVKPEPKQGNGKKRAREVPADGGEDSTESGTKRVRPTRASTKKQ